MKILHFNEYLLLNENNSIDIDDTFVKLIKNKLTFHYKVRKDKYIKVKDVLGNIADDNFDINIKLSNKDTIKLDYQNSDFKIYINDELIYDLDDIDYNNTIAITKKIYDKYLEQQGFNIIKKDNPFKK